MSNAIMEGKKYTLQSQSNQTQFFLCPKLLTC